MSNKTIKGLSDKIDLFYQTLKNEQNKMQDSITALFNFINSKKQYLAEDLDGIIKSFHNPDEDIKQENIKIMITGTYNSGKSSLLNALLGKEERSTGNIPTTSDIEMIKWKDLIFYDTPGIDAIEHSVLEDVFK
jgi:ribosome biogenesis GTPase A